MKECGELRTRKKIGRLIRLGQGDRQPERNTASSQREKNSAARQRERIFAASGFMPRHIHFPCGPGPALPAAPPGGSASHQQLHFFFGSRVSDANEKTAKMHQEVSSPFPFLLAPGTVDFSFFFWVF